MTTPEQLAAADYLVTLVAAALRLGHPAGVKLARSGQLANFLEMTDAQRAILTARLEGWISRHRTALPAPAGERSAV